MRPSRTASLAASALLLGSLAATASGCATTEEADEAQSSEDELRRTNDPFNPKSCTGTKPLDPNRFPYDDGFEGVTDSWRFWNWLGARRPTFWEAIDKRTCTRGATGATPAYTCTEWEQHARTEGYEGEEWGDHGRYGIFGISPDGKRAYVEGEDISATCSVGGSAILCTANMERIADPRVARGVLYPKCARVVTDSAFDQWLSTTSWVEYRAAVLIRF